MGEDINCEEVRVGDLERIIRRINNENDGSSDVILKDFPYGKYPEGTLVHAVRDEKAPFVGITLVIPQSPYIPFVNNGGKFWRSRKNSFDFLQSIYLSVAEVIDDFFGEEDGGAFDAAEVGMEVDTGGFYI